MIIHHLVKGRDMLDFEDETEEAGPAYSWGSLIEGAVGAQFG